MRQIRGGGGQSRAYLDSKKLKPFCFEGCFQNLAYFDNIKEILMQDFTLKIPLDSKNTAMKNRILNAKECAFLHIRRGDYLTGDNAKLYVKLDSKYYNGALNALLKRLKNIESKIDIFVFSNDILWCKKHFVNSLQAALRVHFNFIFVDINNEGNAASELTLMSLCKHNIIANSTFSFWAAYLNANDKKNVICPDRLLHYAPCSAFDNYENKIYPKKWIKINHLTGKEI